MATCSLHENDRLDAEFLRSEGVIINEMEHHKTSRNCYSKTPSLLTCVGCLFAQREKPFCIEGYEISSEVGAKEYLVHLPGGRDQTVALWTELQSGPWHGGISLLFVKKDKSMVQSSYLVLGKGRDVLCELQIGPAFKELHKRTLMAHLYSVAVEKARKPESFHRFTKKSKAMESTAGQTPRVLLHEDDDDGDAHYTPLLTEKQIGEESQNISSEPGARKDSAVHQNLVDESHINDSEKESEVAQSPRIAAAPEVEATTSPELTADSLAQQEPSSVLNIDISAAINTFTIEEAREAFPDIAKATEETRAEEAKTNRRIDAMQKAVERCETERKKCMKGKATSEKEEAAARLESAKEKLRSLEERALKMGIAIPKGFMK